MCVCVCVCVCVYAKGLDSYHSNKLGVNMFVGTKLAK